MTVSRPRCPEGKHAGLVPGKLFCTACGGDRHKTEADYAAAEERKRVEIRIRYLEQRIAELGGAPVLPEERNVPFMEAWIRILVGAATDPDPEPESDDGFDIEEFLD